MSTTQPDKKPGLGQSVIVKDDDGTEVPGMVVDALDVQFTFIPFNEPDVRRVRFCFYNGDWE